MPPKRTMDIVESEVADALAMLRGQKPSAHPQKEAPVPVDPPRQSKAEIELKDGSSLDLAAYFSVSMESFMAKYHAMGYFGGVQVSPGTSGYKRPIEPSSTHRHNKNKRLRQNEVLADGDPSQGFSQDEQESEESVSEEDGEDFTFSSVFGVGINDADPPAVGRSVVARSESGAPASLSVPDDPNDLPANESGTGTDAHGLGDNGKMEENEWI